MKKFYSVRLKEYRESIPHDVAMDMLVHESPMIKYLHDNKALEFKFVKSRHRLDCYADEKFLTMAQMKFENIFGDKGRMGFMELYISRMISKKLQLAKGST